MRVLNINWGNQEDGVLEGKRRQGLEKIDTDAKAAHMKIFLKISQGKQNKGELGINPSCSIPSVIVHTTLTGQDPEPPGRQASGHTGEK